MLKLRREHLEALRPLARGEIANRILREVEAQGSDAGRDPKTGDLWIADGRGYESRLSFHPDGLPATLQQPSGSRQSFEHDDQGRLRAIDFPGEERLEISRDEKGNVSKLERPGLLSYSLEHDDQDRLTSARYPDGSTVRLQYHSTGALSTISDRAGATTKYERDSDGRLQAIVDPLDRRTTYLTDPDGHLESVVFPDGSRQDYRFDPEAGVATVSQRDGSTVRQELDAAGAIKTIDWGDGSRIEFRFDEAGNLEEARNETSTVVQSFDENGNPLVEENSAGQIEYEYDPDGRLVRLSNPFGETVEYEYDEDGRPCLVRSFDGLESRITYQTNGAIAEIQHANGLTEKHQYARVGRLARAVVQGKNGRALAEQNYRYDPNERLIGVSEKGPAGSNLGPARELRYDDEHRLLGEYEPETGRPVVEFVYDSKGNLVKDAGTTVSVGPLDEPTRYGNEEIEYDGNGNMLRLPGPRGSIRCSFDAAGRLKQTSAGGQSFRYEYDAFCRRILKTDGRSTWRYGWAGQQLLWEEFEENAGGTNIRRDYVWIPGSVSPLGFREQGRTYWLQTDARGAVIAAYDEEGQVAWRASYESFGGAKVSVATVRQPWRLAGQYEDEETGLYYNYARYYSPKIKSYLSRDPNWHAAGTTNYSYARNDPWNRADPYGAIAPLLVGLGIVVVGAVVGAVIEGVTGGDPVAGAVEGGLAAAGAVIGALGGPVGVVVGGVIGSAAGGFAGELTRQARRGDELCFSCAAKVGLAAGAVDILLLGLGKIPGVKKAAQFVARKVGDAAVGLFNKLKNVFSKADFVPTWPSPRASELLEELAEATTAHEKRRLSEQYGNEAAKNHLQGRLGKEIPDNPLNDAAEGSFTTFEGPHTVNLYYKDPDTGRVFVLEAKGRGSPGEPRMGTRTVRHGPNQGQVVEQGSIEYLEDVATTMQNSNNPAKQEAGTEILEAIAEDRVEYIGVKGGYDGSAPTGSPAQDPTEIFHVTGD